MPLPVAHDLPVTASLHLLQGPRAHACAGDALLRRLDAYLHSLMRPPH